MYNKVADALSRVLPGCMAISTATPMWAEDLLDSYQRDADSKNLLEKLLLQPDHKDGDYSLHSGIIRYKGKILVGNIPPLRNKLLAALHSSPVGGHSGNRATYQSEINFVLAWA